MELKQAIERQSKHFDSFYLYDEMSILSQIACLKENFPQIEFLYSVKCNPHERVLNSIFAQGWGADAASLREVEVSANAGLPKEKIYYSAPGKTEKDLEGAMDKSVLIADSIGEIKKIQTIAQGKKQIIKIGIRINPDFTFAGEGGSSSKFGMDEEQAVEFIRSNSCRNVNITGIHVHLKSQELDVEALGAYYRKMFVLAEKMAGICGELEYVNMGSGIGIAYNPADQEIDMVLLGKLMKEEFDRFHARYPNTKVLIEVGRYAVCKSGYYVTKVLDRKTSYGKTYLILKNTLNGFLRPSMARLIMSCAAEEPTGKEPLFTKENAFAFMTLRESAPKEKVTLMGNLCTAADMIADNIELPCLEEGDCLIITNAGSYAAVLSPMQFSSQERPQEFFLTMDGMIL